jgi:ankyrin repeat protein
VKLLLETSRVDVNSEDSSGQTPLSWAALHGHDAVVKPALPPRLLKPAGQPNDQGGATNTNVCDNYNHGVTPRRWNEVQPLWSVCNSMSVTMLHRVQQ